MAAGRIRDGRDKGFQGVSIADNWRTSWFKNRETAQKHLDEHLEGLKGSSKKAAKKSGHEEHVHVADGADKNAENELVEQGADDIPPGGQDTGPRG